MTAERNSFAQKVLVGLIGILSVGLLGFFAWLATTLVDIQGRVVRMETNIDSLLETRTVQAGETVNRNARRIEELERAEAKGRAER